MKQIVQPHLVKFYYQSLLVCRFVFSLQNQPYCSNGIVYHAIWNLFHSQTSRMMSVLTDQMFNKTTTSKLTKCENKLNNKIYLLESMFIPSCKHTELFLFGHFFTSIGKSLLVFVGLSRLDHFRDDSTENF